MTKKPRYINEDKCTGCTTCVGYCPVTYPDKFNQDISENKAVHIYFSQAIPLVAYIDESCLYLKEKKCLICEGACQAGAIDLHQQPEKIAINVGAIILSLGLEPFDPKVKSEYAYGKIANVLTSMDYERLLSSTGAYRGEILRASDGKHPHKVAWIQCVGSRRVTAGDNSYCSAVCCTYTQKQVILTKDHEPDAECTVFHNDVRSYGKDFERYFQRAENLPGTRFIRSYASIVGEDPLTKNVRVKYATTDGGVIEEEFDMVVLSIGLNPPSGVQDLARTFGIELDCHGFCKSDPANPIGTSRSGVFVSGCFQGPTDIPESVFTASGASAQCGELLNYRRGKLNKARIYPQERDVSREEPRIGVFVCHCGANIGSVVNVPSVVDYAKTLPNVVYAHEQLFSCATNSAREISDITKEKGLNRVVIAACSPRTLEPLFQDTLREAGINKYYCDMANIREHNSWVHSKVKQEATDKAKDIVRMSVARAFHLAPLQEFDLPVTKSALVVGGGIAGMTCALSIASQGHRVILLERDSELGGMARRIHYTLEGLYVQKILADTISAVYHNPLIQVFHSATILDVSGYVGNFVTTLMSEGRLARIKHGATVLAAGAEEYRPSEYLYGQFENVITQLELEDKIYQEDMKQLGDSTVVMIQCVGCRQQDRNYCSRICCSQAIKNAIKLKEINRAIDVYILFRDIRTYGFREDYYRVASNMDVKFIRYEPDNHPRLQTNVQDGRGTMRIAIYDQILGLDLEIDADTLVLSAAVVPSTSGEELAGQFKVTLSQDGFFKEAHAKLRPVEFATDGVYLCGMAQYPKHIQESINQAYGAAGRVCTLLSRSTIAASGSVCEVNQNSCISCGACITVCSYGAIEFIDTPRGRKATVNPILCKGDGLCNTKCPTGAIYLKHFTDEVLLGQIDASTLGL